MKASHIATRAGVIAGAAFMLFAAFGAAAQDYPDDGNSDEMRTRIQRLERDIHDLQQEIYRGNGSAPRSLSPPPASADVPPAQAAPLAQRIADMEDTLQRLTGQIEELQNQNRSLTTKVDRLQRALDYQQGNTPGATPGAGPSPGTGAQSSYDPAMSDMTPAEAPAATVPRALAPGPSTLGTIPQNTPMPTPKPPGAAVHAGGDSTGVGNGAPAPAPGQRVASLPPSTGVVAGGAPAEYESAMALLRKAQYAAAQQAFRAFADAHPADARAPDALYWTGDIAYSARRDYGSAARAFAELLKKYGKAGRAPEGMLKLGLSLLGLGQKQEGCATLAALPVKYANAAPALVARAAAERKRAACT